MRLKKRIVLVFDSTFAYRSFSESGVHSALELEYETTFLFIHTNKNKMFQVIPFRSKVHYLKLSRVTQAFLSLFATSYWQRKSHLSNSFRVRILSLLMGRRLFYSEPKPAGFKLLSLKTTLGVALGRLNLSAPRIMYQFAGRSIQRFLKRANPNLIIYITTGGGTGLADLLKVTSDSISIKTLVMMDNWDNIYSKAVFNFIPDQITVWNERAREFAFKVHQIPLKNISILPSPRVNYLIEEFRQESLTPGYVLFAGGSLHISYDSKWLNILYDELIRINPGIQIRYLPHPLNYQNLFKINSLLNRLGIELAWNLFSEAIKVLPPLRLYPKLYKDSLCVVSPLSTMSLEAAILGINSIGIDFSDDFDGSSHSAFDTFEHHWDLCDFNNFHLVRSATEMRQILLKNKTLSRKQKPDILHKPKSPEEDLFRIIEKLIVV